MAKKTKYSPESEFEKHIRQNALVAHQTPEHFHKKRVFKEASAGAGDAGHPVKLNSVGVVDKSMMPPIVLLDDAEGGRRFYISDIAPTGGQGNNGDLWFEY